MTHNIFEGSKKYKNHPMEAEEAKKYGDELKLLSITTGYDVPSRIETIRAVCPYYTLDSLLRQLIFRNELDYIKDHMYNIILCYDIDFLTRRGILKQLKEAAPEKFSEYHSLIVSRLFNIQSLNYADPTMLNNLTRIVEIIAKNEEKDISEIKYIGYYNHSFISKLGNKVIKIGIANKRKTYKTPYHRRLLQPIIRRKILPTEPNRFQVEDLIIEISEYLKPDKSITEEDVYSVYKELREAGIVWTNPRKEYLGRLEKENTIHYHYNNEPLYNDKESFGFIPETIKDEKPLQKGDLVITNLDYLFRETDPHINPISVNQDSYGKRYLEEKNNTAALEER